MTKEKYIADLHDIKDMMSRSSKFISLSGWSGISAGICALLGALAAYQTVYMGQDYLGYRQAVLTMDSLLTLLMIALVVLVAAIGSGIFFTTQKAKKQNQAVWDAQTKRLLINLFIPLATGGVFSLILLSKGYIGIVAPLTLIFYGLGLVNASKYTLTEIRSLGLVQIVLGLIGAQFIGYGLIFWAIGFGVMHVVYGIFMQLKYKS